MTEHEFMNNVYDILAQNSKWATTQVKTEITALIDHIDSTDNYIEFRNARGVEFRLQLVKTYAPTSERSK